MFNSDGIFVYHGSYTKIEKIDLSLSRPNKDFGKGFYVTTDKKQAIKFAKLVAKRNDKKRCYVNCYKILDFNKLKVKEFKNTNSDWLNCVVGFRDNKYNDLASKYVDYDVIIGKIADDETSLVINAYLAGVYGDVASKFACDTAIRLLKPNVLKDQLCFRSNTAIKKLKFISCEEIIND